MAIYNVNKDTGDITETAGRYGSSNSVFYGTIAQWNALTTEQKKTYDHASIPDSLDGNVTFPANKVVMTGGGNVEDALTEVAVKTKTYTGTTTASGNLIDIHVPLTNAIVSINTADVGEICFPTKGATNWGCHIAEWGALAPIASKSVTLTIYYI